VTYKEYEQGHEFSEIQRLDALNFIKKTHMAVKNESH
jgi:hypothetical protein